MAMLDTVILKSGRAKVTGLAVLACFDFPQ